MGCRILQKHSPFGNSGVGCSSALVRNPSTPPWAWKRDATDTMPQPSPGSLESHQTNSWFASRRTVAFADSGLLGSVKDPWTRVTNGINQLPDASGPSSLFPYRRIHRHRPVASSCRNGATTSLRNELTTRQICPLISGGCWRGLPVEVSTLGLDRP